jgi:CrcB protein
MFITRRQVETLFLIGVGGFVGANVRFLVSGWVAQQLGVRFPWGTLVVNFTGSLLLALFIAWAAGYTTLDSRIRLFLATGFFGAYTTFSTYATESVALLQGGDWIGALGNVLGTNLVCLIGAIVGLAIGSRL